MIDAYSLISDKVEFIELDGICFQVWLNEIKRLVIGVIAIKQQNMFPLKWGKRKIDNMQSYPCNTKRRVQKTINLSEV